MRTTPQIRRVLKTLKAVKVLNNNKGMALIVAMAALVMIVYIATEVSYDTNVEYIVNSNSMSRLKAYYAAKSATELSLLRIKTYQQVMNSPMVKQMGGNASMLDQIWQFPFAWPVPVPDNLQTIDKDNIKNVLKESSFDASYSVIIEDEGSKIDLTDLNSPSKVLREITSKRLVDIFENKKKSDIKFMQKYGSVRFDELVNNIADWGSDKRLGVGGNDKRNQYRDYPSEGFPPNRAFRTIQEVRMVPGMNEDFFELIEPYITVYGMKAINPNYASKEILMSIDPGFTEDVAKKIMEQRDSPTGGPFTDRKAFDEFVINGPPRAQVSESYEQVPMIFDRIYNFRIKALGEFAGVSREITTVVMDMPNIAAAIKKQVDEEKKKEQEAQSQASGGPAPSPTPKTQDQSKSATLPKGPPRIVYWSER